MLSKVAKSSFTEDLLSRSVRGHTRALAVHFQSLAGIAGFLCESNKPLCNAVGEGSE